MTELKYNRVGNTAGGRRTDEGLSMYVLHTGAGRPSPPLRPTDQPHRTRCFSRCVSVCAEEGQELFRFQFGSCWLHNRDSRRWFCWNWGCTPRIFNHFPPFQRYLSWLHMGYWHCWSLLHTRSYYAADASLLTTGTGLFQSNWGGNKPQTAAATPARRQREVFCVALRDVPLCSIKYASLGMPVNKHSIKIGDS